MDLSSLGATFEANKTPILAAAGAGVVGLGLYAKKKKATTSAGGVATAGGASSGGQTAGMTGGAAYDSSASDLYGAIQPQLESLGGQLTDLRNLYASKPAPTPVPAATPAPAPISTGPAAPSTSATPTPVYDAGSAHIAQTLANTTGAAMSWTPSNTTQAQNGYTGGTIAPTSGVPMQVDGIHPQPYMGYATGPNTYGLMTGFPTTGSEGPIGTVLPDGMGGYNKVTAYTFNGLPSHVNSTKDGLTIGPNGQPIPGSAPTWL